MVIGMTDLTELIKKLQMQLEGIEDIACAYLFGSIVTGHMTEESDIDIAVLLNTQDNIRRYAEISRLLSEQLVRALSTDKVDLVILNTADPLLRFEVAVKGKLIFERQLEAADNFKIKAIKMHMDSEKFYELDKQAIKKFLSEMKQGA
jgi:predicted nucleotidyltransferase